jgi:hypothetical protein
LLDDPMRIPAAAPRPSSLEVFTHCIGLLSLNEDKHVTKKLKSKGMQGLSEPLVLGTTPSPCNLIFPNTPVTLSR